MINTKTTQPNVKLGQYKKLPIKKATHKVSSKDVNQLLDYLRKEHAKLVDTHQPIKHGDVVTLNFVGYLNGKPFDGGAAYDYSLKLGSHSFVGNFEKQLIGHQAGEHVTINVRFPKHYQAEFLNNKVTTFKVNILSVQHTKEPELNNAFAHQIDKNINSLTDLKAILKKDLQAKLNNKAKRGLRNRAINLVTKNAKVSNLSNNFVKAKVSSQIKSYLNNLKQQKVNPTEFFKLTDSTKSQLIKRFSESAKNLVKTKLVLDKIADIEHLKPSETDLDKLATIHHTTPQNIKNAVSKKNLNQYLRDYLATNFIVKSAINEK